MGEERYVYDISTGMIYDRVNCKYLINAVSIDRLNEQDRQIERLKEAICKIYERNDNRLAKERNERWQEIEHYSKKRKKYKKKIKEQAKQIMGLIEYLAELGYKDLYWAIKKDGRYKCFSGTLRPNIIFQNICEQIQGQGETNDNRNK